VIRALAAGVLGVVAALAALPLLAAGGGSAGPIGPYVCASTEDILDTIRTVESGGNYQATSPTSSASGAYQFIDATWRHYAAQADINITRYPRAHLAPAADQDAAASAHILQILADHPGDIAVIPLVWYLPAAVDDPDLLDVVPPHNQLTPRQYQERWLDVYNTKLAAHGRPGTCDNGSGRWALPTPRAAIRPDTLDNPHHDYPAWDLLIPVGTSVHAITDGVVVTVQHWDGNWWTAGCDRQDAPAGCNTCGNGITIAIGDHLRHTYCHNQRLHVTIGEQVTAGQRIADSGNTGRSGTPHLHLELRIDGRQHCPQPLLDAIYHGTPVPEPARLPIAGCTS
jgi:hypothetical protein